jgi:hypothetical protein
MSDADVELGPVDYVVVASVAAPHRQPVPS